MSEFDARVFDLNLKKEENRRILDWDIADRGVRDCHPPQLEATIATSDGTADDDVNLCDFTDVVEISVDESGADGTTQTETGSSVSAVSKDVGICKLSDHILVSISTSDLTRVTVSE